MSRLWSARARWLPEGLVLALVSILTWPVGTLSPSTTLDGSWVVGLHMANHTGLEFGHDLIFTYGPLGFLNTPWAIHPWQLRMAFAYEGITHVLLCASLIWALRAGLGSLLVAGAFTFYLVPLVIEQPVVPTAFIATVALAAGRVPPRAVPVVAAGIGVLAATSLLGKLNSGVTITAVAVVGLAVATVRRRDAAVAGGAGLVVTLAAGWFGTGHGFGDMADFVQGSLEIARGYSEAMGIDGPEQHGWEIWSVLPFAAVGVAAAWHAGGELPARTRAGLVLMWLILAGASFKTGFVRHDFGHVGIFYVTAIGGLAAFAWAARRVTIVVVGVLALFVFFQTQPYGVFALAKPRERADALWSQLGALSDGSETNKKVLESKNALAAAFPLDPDTFEMIGRRDVHVYPDLAAVTRAYSLRWNPLRVFQTYSAYTKDLDERNAEEMEGSRAPELILYAFPPMALDGRHPSWDSPAATRAMLCNYRPIRTTERWMLLEHVPSRCGPPRPLSETKAPWGEPHSVPAGRANEIIYGRVDGVSVEGFEKVRTAVHRAVPRHVQINGDVWFRLVPDTAQNGLMAHVPAAVDFPAPYRMEPGARTLTFQYGEGDQPDDDVTVRWFAVSVR